MPDYTGGQNGGRRCPDPDSRARTHLASERTVLAWLRTGLGLIILGLAAAEFLDRDPTPGIPVVPAFAIFLIARGSGLAVIGGVQYARSRNRIEAEEHRPAGRSIMAAVGLIVVVGVLSATLVLLLRGT